MLVQQLSLAMEILAALTDFSKDSLETSRLDHVSSCSENFALSQLGEEAFAVLISLSNLTSVITLSLLLRGFSF